MTRKTTPGHIRISDEMYERLHPPPPEPPAEPALSAAELAEIFRPMMAPPVPRQRGFVMGYCPHCGGVL